MAEQKNDQPTKSEQADRDRFAYRAFVAKQTPVFEGT